MQSDVRLHTRLALLLRCLIAALLAPVLAAGALDLHSSDLPHSPFDGPSVVLADARHPLEPVHLESSVAIRVPPCLACLLQSKTSRGAVIAPAIEPDPIVANAGPATLAEAPSLPVTYSLGSRGPPLA